MFNRVIMGIVGTSESGKTTVLEALVRGLTKKGYTVGSAKRIPEPEFTIDTVGKDTWRHAKSGAINILSVAPKELTIIKKINTKKITLEQLILEFSDEIDIIILEGFKGLIGRDITIPKIVATKTETEISVANNYFKNIIAFVGKDSDGKTNKEIPFLNVLENPEKLVDLVIKHIKILVERKRKREEKITIYLNDKMLPLGNFVQDIVRNTILAMVSSLKGVNLGLTKDFEKVKVIITTKNKVEKMRINNQ